MSDWERMTDDEYWKSFLRQEKSEEVNTSRKGLLADMQRVLLHLLDRSARHPECQHSTFMRYLRSLLGYPPSANDDYKFLRQALAEFDDHLAQCRSSAEDNALRTGIDIYAEFLTNVDDSIRARQWVRNTPEPRSLPEHAACQPAPALLPEIVHVASYIGPAGLGGILGNRADAIFMATARRLFGSVHDRWLRRTSANDAALSRDEAIDAVIAAAATLEYDPQTFILLSATQEADKSWLVKASARSISAPEDTEMLRARVPTGDPSSAFILIYHE